jgi:serine/threonine protein kinase/tetratricopeptide (TPR) repeat protein
MDLSGLADSAAGFVDGSPRCHCGSVARIGGGLCVSCLLRAALGQEETEKATFDSVLAQIDVPDRDWQLGNYQILEEIGRGGMGVIYRARHRPSGRIVALKRVLSYHSDSRDTLSRFQREARAAASLEHANILPIYDVGATEDGLPFFSMKFAPGGSLLDARSTFRNAARCAVQLLAKVARAVDYAHSMSILHRDLKPGNILLDSRGEPLVSDFGLAKWLDATSDLTGTMTVFGTPGYIAPEQVHGPAGNLTPAVDIYSLGAILFELLSGRPPFLGEHAIAVIRQAGEKPAPKLRSIARDQDRDLETICARCLESEPGARYQSAGDLAADLTRWLEDRPIVARPVSPAVRSWRWSRRNPALATSLAGISLLVAIVLARQVQTRRLQIALESDAAVSHAVTILPFLDLDEVQPDFETTSRVATFLESGMKTQGPSRITRLDKVGPHWTGAALQDEIREVSNRTKSRAVLEGTRRIVNGNARVSLHLVRENGADVLGNWLIELNPADPLLSPNGAPDLAASIYKLLDQSTSPASAEDPTMTNERARAFLMAGRDLIGRRTIADLDRAIACFEGAIREEPKSVTARSFLAMAIMGRDLLGSSSPLAPRALQVAREAVRLAPSDPTANRGLCAVCVSNGLYPDALEYGFCSLEFGDRSGRALGQIAYTWRARGRPDKAIKWYVRAKASQQRTADFDYLLGDCWADLQNDEEARRAYESAATFQPDQPDGWLGLARLKLLNGDSNGARQLCRAELLHYPDSPVARQFAALLEFFTRHYGEAGHLYQDLAKSDPVGGGRDGTYGAVDYRSAIARVKIESGKNSEARRLLLEVSDAAKWKLASAADDPETLYRLSAAEAMLGQTEASLNHLRAAIKEGWIDYRSTQLDPRFDSIRARLEFRTILSELAAYVASLGRHSSAVPSATSQK